MSDGTTGFEVRKIYLSFRGPKGNNFGQELIIEIKVVFDAPVMTSLNQEDLLKQAFYMFEKMNLGSFDECVEALKKCNGDQNAACQLFLEKM